MYLIAIAWLYVVLMMALAEALSAQGSVLGAAVTFVLYGLLPLGLVTYIVGTPGRKRRLRAEAAAAMSSAAATVATTAPSTAPTTATAATATTVATANTATTDTVGVTAGAASSSHAAPDGSGHATAALPQPGAAPMRKEA